MATRKINRPAELSESEWKYLLKMFARSSFLPTIEKMHAAKNKPQKAQDILSEHIVNQGHEHINAILRDEKAGLRLTRIGSWVREVSRDRRMLAFVRWDEKTKKAAAR